MDRACDLAEVEAETETGWAVEVLANEYITTARHHTNIMIYHEQRAGRRSK